MAIFTITTNALTNLPPNVIGDAYVNTLYGVQLVFTVADFSTNTIPAYNDPEGDALLKVKVLTLPTLGTLKKNAVAVNVNDEITVTEIGSNLLTYDNPVFETVGYVDSTMTFDLQDAGSLTYSGLGPKKVYITVGEKINSAPVIGDNTLNTDYATTIVFTIANFTTETTPPYSDADGDAADKLKIITLPVDGTLMFNQIPVTINQIIDFTDIGTGLLTYVTDADVIITQNLHFDFAIADAGSGIFVT